MCVPPVTILSQLDPVHTPSHFLKIHLNIILPSMSESPKWSPLSQVSPTKSCIHLSSPLLSPYTLHAQLISFFSSLSSENYWRTSTDHEAPRYVVFSTPLLPLLSLSPKYSRQHAILKHPQPTFLPQCERPSFMPVHHNRQKYYFVFDFIILYILTFKFLDSKLEDKIFCTCPDFNLLLISSWIQFWFVKVFHKYLNSSTLPKQLLSDFVLWLHPALWDWDMTMYLDLSAFTSCPVSILTTATDSPFSFTVCTLPPSILTSSAQARSWCVAFSFKPSWFT